MTQTARLYGGSLYDLAAEENLTERIMEEMGAVRSLFRENPDYVKLLSEPSIPTSDRTKLIEDAFGQQAERYLVNFLKLLCEKNLLREFGGCVEEFTRRFNLDHQIAEAVVTSAVPLSEEQAERLRKRLEEISNKKISLVRKVDPKILAGLTVELEGKQLDGTVKGRLSGFSRKLAEVTV